MKNEEPLRFLFLLTSQLRGEPVDLGQQPLFNFRWILPSLYKLSSGLSELLHDLQAVEAYLELLLTSRSCSSMSIPEVASHDCFFGIFTSIQSGLATSPRKDQDQMFNGNDHGTVGTPSQHVDSKFKTKHQTSF